MIKSLVVYTRFFSVFCALLWVFHIGTASAMQDLSEEDRAFIKNADKLAKKMREIDTPLPLKNKHAASAKAEAMAFFQKLQQSDPTLSAMKKSQEEKSTYTEHTVLVFASLSLGKQGLDDMLTAVSGMQDAVIVLRGIPEGMNIGQGVLEIQKLAATKTPVPNIIINPLLFNKHNITAVPMIVILEDNPNSIKEPEEVARVAGLSDPLWLLNQVDSGEEGDLGFRGPVEEISERDLIEVAKERLAKIDWQEKQEQALKRYWQKRQFNELSPATRPRIREIDPSIYITSDITDHDGITIIKKGTIINPLDVREFPVAVVVFDPMDKKQLALVKKVMPAIESQPGIQQVMYIATRMDREDGWNFHKKISDYFDAHIYLLESEMVERFELEFTPSIITAKNKRFVIKELFEGEEK